jgi:Zn-dependent protease with chaperone function
MKYHCAVSSRLLPTFLVIFATLLLSGCATNSMTGRSQFALVSEKSAITQSAQAYSSMMSGLDKNGKISQDEALNNRVKGITDKLITQAVRFRPEVKDWSWNVKVIDDPKTVNAFCMAGGKMAIYTGLIEKTHATDDELAQVMGHEIAHALAGHTAEKMSVKMAADLVVAVVAAAGRSSQDQHNRQNIGNMLASTGITLPNSRQAEDEADKLGIELAARAGYDPHAAVSLWTKMMNASGDSSRFDFLSTHPASPKRVESLAALEQPMMKFYEEAKSNTGKQPMRAWTSLSPNEQEINETSSQLATVQANQPPLTFYSPEFDKFQQGATELTCGAECAAPYLLKQSSLKESHNNKNWRVLALDTIKIGYRFDLSYYYLGTAAQGLGFNNAAKKYFEDSIKLSENKDSSCANGFILGCGGIDVIQASRQALSSLVLEPKQELQAKTVGN